MFKKLEAWNMDAKKFYIDAIWWFDPIQYGHMLKARATYNVLNQLKITIIYKCMGLLWQMTA